MDAVERWLEENTFRCALGRVSPAQCQALRARPVFDPAHPGGGPYRPQECINCKGEKKMEDQAQYAMSKEPASAALPAASLSQKKCARCGRVKPVGEFYRDKKNRDGYASWCKDCQKERAKELKAGKKKDKGERKKVKDHPASNPSPLAFDLAPGAKRPIRCALCRRRLNWYDEDQDMGFVMEHYELPAGPVCIVCFSRLYGMKGFEEQSHE